MSEIEIFGKCKWVTLDDGRKIPLYDGFSFDESIKITQHYKILQTMVDDYPKLYKEGKNYKIVDNYEYKFIVRKGDRKVILKGRMVYDGRYDEF